MANPHDFTLPPELEKVLDQFSGWFAERKIAPELLQIILDRLAVLPPRSIVRADGDIAGRARLYSWSRHHKITPSSDGTVVSLLSGLLKRPVSALASEEELLAKVDRLEWLFLFHRNGYMREAALAKLSSPALSPFFAAAIAYRLNDWVFEVRQAAVKAATRVFAETPADILAEAAEYLLDRDLHWGRWQDEGRVLETTLSRAEVVERLAKRLATATGGPMAKMMRSAFRYPGLESYLPELARSAFLPSVRVLALQSLIAGRARWPIGYEKVWVDKTMGFYRHQVAYAERALSHAVNLEELLRQGAHDRSAMVRKVAATALVQNRHTLGNRDEIIALLKDDRSPSVQSAVEFVIRDLTAAASVSSPASS